MNVIAVAGTCGGVGVTTVAAQLAAGLVAQRRHTIAFDFSPDNALRLHFGMAWDDETGLAPAIITGQPWHETAFRSAGDVDFIPFGKPGDGHTAADLEPSLAAQPRWLASCIEELDMPAETYVICDCPRTDSALRSQALAAADLTLIVATPDALSYASACAAAEAAWEQGAREIAFVLNGFDPTRALDQDVAMLMRTDFSANLAPVVLHRDESLREALASKQSVFDYAPSSRAVYDFSALAMWVVAHMAHPHENTVHKRQAA